MFGPVLHIICQPAKIQNHQNPASASVATGCNRNWDKDMPAALAAREVQVLATPWRNSIRFSRRAKKESCGSNLSEITESQDFSWPKGDLVPSLVPSIVPCDSSSFLTHLSCWSRTKCLAATLPQLGLEITESVALQGSSRGHWGLIVVWPVLPIFVFGKGQPVILCFAVHKFRTATITCKLSTTDFGERTKRMQRVVDMLKTVLWTNWSLYLRAIVCTTIVDKSRPPFHAKPLVRLLSICPRFACRYYRRIRSHRLRQQGSCSAVSCTCSFEITFLQCWRLLLPDFYLQGTSANKQKVPTCRCRTDSRLEISCVSRSLIRYMWCTCLSMSCDN